jgi:hypothetical protein
MEDRRESDFQNIFLGYHAQAREMCSGSPVSKAAVEQSMQRSSNPNHGS